MGHKNVPQATVAKVAMPPLWLVRVAETSITAKTKFEPTLEQRHIPDASLVVLFRWI